MENQEVTLGSGDLYIKKFEGAIPEHSALEVDENKIGGILGGAQLSYKPTVYVVKDDKGVVHKCFITDTEVSLKSGIMTWCNDVLNTLALGGELTKTGNKSVLKLGKRGAIDNYIIRFVHEKDTGLKYRVTIVGTCQNGFELLFDPGKETVIDAEFIAGSLDKEGTKLILEEELKAQN